MSELEVQDELKFKPVDLITIDTIFSIVGACFVAFGNSFYANCLWSMGNVFLIRRNYKTGDSAQLALFCVFEVIAVIGVVNYLRGGY